MTESTEKKLDMTASFDKIAGGVKHSVFLDVDKCKGCTTCIKHCPTEAIRVRDGHAQIENDRCIDCGECIRVCQYRAKRSSYDKLEDFSHYKYKIALPAPAIYGQFEDQSDLEPILTALLQCGFDHVFEVARAAEIVSEYTRKYLERHENCEKPVISSACPVVLRLIGIRYPLLIDNLLPVMAPIEVAARVARKEALERRPDLTDEDICVLFVSPCPAKVSYVKNPLGIEKSAVNGALSIGDIYFKMRSLMKNPGDASVPTEAGIIGISWAGTGGESSALMNDHYLAADGIENVIHVLDEIEKENFVGLQFVELNACNGGCVGGTLNVENPYIAKARLQSLRRYLPVSLNHIPQMDPGDALPTDVLWDTEVSYTNVTRLSSNRAEAMRKMAQIQEIRESLCDLDCGSCGAPTCQALAEDIVKGEASPDDCIIRLRQKLRETENKEN